MKGIKPSLALAAVGVLGLSLWAGAQIDDAGGEMARSADRLLDTLDDQQKAAATFKFDDPERLNWHFIPRERKGLPIKEMNGEQRALAFGLLGTGLSAEGQVKATTIMSLEAILRDMEKGSGPLRDPERYFFSIFGEPSNKGKWGWRVEGHHLSMNVTLEDGRILSATPSFFGSNPAEVRQGPREGLRVLADREDRALRLVQALTDDQKKTAVLANEAPGEIRAAGTAQPPTDPAEGIAYGDLTDDQKAMLRTLVESYAADMPRQVASTWLGEIRDNGPDGVTFAWYGPPDRTAGHAYKIQGPTFLIEFNNTQNGANHVHSIWRSMLGDFGMPLKKAG